MKGMALSVTYEMQQVFPNKRLDLFLREFVYLANSDYITPQQKAEARQNAIDMGLLPREAGGQEVQQATAPPKGTYG